MPTRSSRAGKCDTIKLDFMGIRETQQQQNFGFWANYLTISAAFGHDE